MADERKDPPKLDPPKLSRRRTECLENAVWLVEETPHVVLFPDGIADFVDALIATIRKHHSVGQSLGISRKYDADFVRRQARLSKKGVCIKVLGKSWRMDPKILTFLVYLKLAEPRICHPFEVIELRGSEAVYIHRDEDGCEHIE